MEEAAELLLKAAAPADDKVGCALGDGGASVRRHLVGRRGGGGVNMRVIGGSRRGMRLQTLPGRGTRPTSDRVKEALFNIIAPHVPGARVLRLVRGQRQSRHRGAQPRSGGGGFCRKVAESRGQAVCQPRAHRLQRDAALIVGDVFRTLPKLARQAAPFNIVLLDPPYAQSLGPRCLTALAAAGVVAADGIVVVEHEVQEEMPEHVENFVQIRNARYGGTALTFYRRAQAAAGQGGDA